MKKKVFFIALISILSLFLVVNKKTEAEEVTATSLINEYYNDGMYTKKTQMYLTAETTVEVDNGKVLVEYPKSNFKIEVAQERMENDTICGDFALSFARQYIKSASYKTDRKVLIIRCGVGGTSFAQNHWGMQDICYLKMLEMVDYALKLNESNRIVAFLWHQGESDVINQSSPKDYFYCLSTMLHSVREKYGKIPFIAGDFVHDWKDKNLAICEPIIQEIRHVVMNNETCGFVETDGLLSNDQQIQNGDDIHFCRNSLYELGDRYYKEFLLAKNPN